MMANVPSSFVERYSEIVALAYSEGGGKKRIIKREICLVDTHLCVSHSGGKNLPGLLLGENQRCVGRFARDEVKKHSYSDQNQPNYGINDSGRGRSGN